METPSDILFVGTAGHVVALGLTDKPTDTPKVLWNTALKGTGHHSAHIVYVPGDDLYVSGYDHLFKLKASTGEVVWQVNSDRIGTILMHEKRLLVGHNGYVTCYNPNDGSKFWTANCKGAGWATVTMCVFGNTVFAGCNGEMFGFNIENGNTEWSVSLKGTGNGAISMLPMNTEKGPVLFLGCRGFIVPFDINLHQEIQLEQKLALHNFHNCPVALVDNDHQELWAVSSGGVAKINPNNYEMKIMTELKGHQNALAYSLTTVDVDARKHLFVEGHNGHVYALHIETGHEVWRNEIADHHRFVVVVQHKHTVIAGCYGVICGMDPLIGEKHWTITAKELGVSEGCMGLSTTLVSANPHQNQLFQAEQELALAKRMV